MRLKVLGGLSGCVNRPSPVATPLRDSQFVRHESLILKSAVIALSVAALDANATRTRFSSGSAE